MRAGRAATLFGPIWPFAGSGCAGLCGAFVSPPVLAAHRSLTTSRGEACRPCRGAFAPRPDCLLVVERDLLHLVIVGHGAPRTCVAARNARAAALRLRLCRRHRLRRHRLRHLLGRRG